MRKFIALLLCFVMLSSVVLVSCDSTDSNESGNQDTSQNTTMDNGVNNFDNENTNDENIPSNDSSEDGISFKTLDVDGTDVCGEVSNATTAFSFLNEITISGKATYVVSLDIYGMQTVVTKTVALNAGDNTFYILQVIGDDITLYTITIRRRPMYTVTFDTKGGTSVPNQTIEENSFVTVPTTTKAGFTFVGWDRDMSLPITEDITVTAQWSSNPYTVTYNANSGKVTNPSTNVACGQRYTLETPTKTGYTFAGWYKDEACTEIFDFDNDIVEIKFDEEGNRIYEEFCLYAKWDKKQKGKVNEI